MLILTRNLLIVALLALGLTVLPGGGNLTTAVLTTITLVFVTAIGLVVSRLWRETSFTRDVMPDRDRAIFYGAIGLLALMVVGADQLLESGAGTLAWLAIIGGSIWAMIVVWRQASSY